MIRREFLSRVYHSTPSIVTATLSSAAVTFVAIYDPTGVIDAYCYSKMALVFGKATLPFVKALGTVIIFNSFPKTVENITSKWKNTEMYKDRYVRGDKRIVKKLPPNITPLILPELSAIEKIELANIFSALENLKKARNNDAQRIHYSFLYDKANLFTQTASLSDVKMFIQIAKPLVL